MEWSWQTMGSEAKHLQFCGHWYELVFLPSPKTGLPDTTCGVLPRLGKMLHTPVLFVFSLSLSYASQLPTGVTCKPSSMKTCNDLFCSIELPCRFVLKRDEYRKQNSALMTIWVWAILSSSPYLLLTKGCAISLRNVLLPLPFTSQSSSKFDGADTRILVIGRAEGMA